ncbi:uncharacterized protein LOC141632295 [Silene latifolia]|uniref:uncharacterized protein LOC141632295 n=1 Tax=Silene latifolia TaxID=37657 RepID=UPI003D77947B
MEYLSRILNHVTSILPFKYHPLCAQMQLTHLMFADDLLLFSKGDIPSIMVLLRSFATFSAATGLQMNNLKSNIYFNGVHSSIKSDILQVSGFSEGVLPFKYLGVPISAGKLSIKHCYGLIEKITERIRGFAARKLSYAGRLTLVNSVLTSLYSYWATIFVIPKGVLKRIDALCRNYLWDGSTEYLRSPLVSSAKVCVPKQEGGLGIRDSYAWNLAAICKLSNWVYNHLDSLWVKWVYHVYMKGVPWSSYMPKTDVTWSWKVVCRVRDKFAGAVTSAGQWMHNPAGYTITGGYCWIRHSQPVVSWDKTVWNSWCISKHSFINWLIAREALLLRDKLLQIGVVADSVCCICGADTESHRHLFVQCQYTQKLVKLLSCKLKVKLPTVYLINWIQSKPWAKVMKNVVIAWIQALYYAIWHQRNKARLEGVLDQPEVVLKQISNMLLMRSTFWLKCIKKSSDEAWVKSINY